MTETGHTPGPWHVVRGDSVVFIRAADGSRVAATDTKTCFQRHDDLEIANACLIAAAPEMLDALQALTDAAEGIWSGALIDDARDAIVKARGGTR